MQPPTLAPLAAQLARSVRVSVCATAMALSGACAYDRAPEDTQYLTLLASFPDRAVAVCFVREDDGSEVGCTVQPRVATPDGKLPYRGRELSFSTALPTQRVALVQVPRALVDRELRVRAIAYNSAGASDPSTQFFALRSGAHPFPDPQGSTSGLAHKRRN